VGSDVSTAATAETWSSVGLVRTDVSEVYAASIFRAENNPRALLAKILAMSANG
jgi:hypothetical protein